MKNSKEVLGPCKLTIDGANCGGNVVLEKAYVYRGDPMHMIIGPGHANQLSAEYEIYCEKCGVSYHDYKS